MSSRHATSRLRPQEEDTNVEKYSRRKRSSYRSRSRSRKRSSYRHHERKSKSRSRSSKRTLKKRNRRSNSRSPHYHSRRRRSRSRCNKRHYRHKSRSYSYSHSRSQSRLHDSVSRKSRSESITKNDPSLVNKNKGSISKQNCESFYQHQNQGDCHETRKELKSRNAGDDNVKSQEASSSGSESPTSVHNYPVPRGNPVGDYYNLKDDEPIDKEKIHKEIEEKLRIALAKEGKVYPLPKSEPSHPVFANDGSFIEIFKKMQQQQQNLDNHDSNVKQAPIAAAATPTAAGNVSIPKQKSSQPPPPPIFGRRRGGKILKTGMVAKPKLQSDIDNADPKDFWSIYLREVKKYKNTACDSDGKTRPLVK